MPLASSRYIVAACLTLGVLSLAAAVVAQNAATAETHKAWMNDAADAQEDFREAMAAKNAKAAADALTKIEGLMAHTEAYWAAKKMNDGVKLTRATRAQASAGIAAAKAGKLADANDAFDKMNSACNACHALQLEKR
jgi:hypothetical protein